MQFAYAQQPLTNRGRPGNWDAFNDPALIATLPAAALLYRRHDVKEADTTYVFAPSPAQLFDRVISPETSVALRTAVEKGKLVIALPEVPQLPWLKKSKIPSGADIITDPDKSLIAKNATEAISDTGEIKRNWADGVYTIDTRRTQAAAGWIGGKAIKLSNVEFAIDTTNATVAVQSLDNEPIQRSRHLMISLAAQSVPSSGNKVPFHSQPVVGHISIRAAKGLRVFKRDPASRVSKQISAPYKDGWYRINLDPDLGTYWLFMD